jgi:hypothetical protein
MFSEKLNFLMEITKVQNSMLAAAINVDASHISRLRHGNRRLPKNQTFVKPMAAYFAHQIKLDYQRKILADALGAHSEWAEDKDKTAKLIYDWLTDSRDETGHAVDNIIKSFTASVRNAPKPSIIEPCENLTEGNCYYGIEGKRNAVIRFLSAVLKEDAPQTLLLFSEEEISWLYEDNEFAKKWAALLINVLMKGNRIKIIHSVNRNLNELLQAIAKWIPVYASGAIEPYYYPKIRDGLFQRTLFIAPETAAVISNSVKQQTADMLNIYIDDKNAVSALTKDFDNLLHTCKPLMQIFNATDSEGFKTLYFDFLKAEGDCIVMQSGLSLATLPASNIKEMNNPILSELHTACSNQLAESLKHFSYTEILSLPDMSKTSINVPAIYGKASIELTAEQGAAHIKNIISLMKKYPNYTVAFGDALPQDVIICAKEGVGIMMCKTKEPYSAFAFNEQNMTSAFWDYLSNMKDGRADKAKVIKKLNGLI